MSNSAIFAYIFTVPQNVIDENGHVNNVAYIQWMQEAAIQHGVSAECKTAENTGWFVREHRIEYFLPAFFGDEIEVRTWIEEWKRVRLHRRYEFIRHSDGKVIARGETDWVYVDVKTGRPIAIPGEIKTLFPVMPDQMDTASSIS
jgi:acyl-CoA thioester hydrolase